MSPRVQRAGFLSLLLFAGIVLHWFRLGQPDALVFDEVHFGSYLDAYCCSGKYFFDVHPPLGKLPAALALKLGGYQGGQSFTTLGTPLTRLDARLLRLVPAITGCLIPVLLFVILVQLGASDWAALLGGWAALFDNALLLQTRVMVLEGTLILSILGAVSLALAAVNQRDGFRQILFSLAAGLCAGVAAGTKFTGLTGGFLVAVIMLTPWHRKPGLSRAIGLGALAALAAIGVYAAGWVAHFSLLDKPGPGDIWGRPGGQMLQDILDIHAAMLQANYGLSATHPNGSSWWGWPWMWRPIYYYAGADAAIYFIGNPVVWWGTSLGLLAVFWTTIRDAFGKPAGSGIPAATAIPRLIPLLGFLVSYLPYLLIPRVMFLYHYLPSLMFSICAVVVWMDGAGWTRPGRFQDQARVVRWLFVLIPVGFLIMSPLTYGLTLPGAVLNAIVRLVYS